MVVVKEKKLMRCEANSASRLKSSLWFTTSEARQNLGENTYLMRSAKSARKIKTLFWKIDLCLCLNLFEFKILACAVGSLGVMTKKQQNRASSSLD